MSVTERSRLYTELVRHGVIEEDNHIGTAVDNRGITRAAPVRLVRFRGQTYVREPGPPSQALMNWLELPLKWWDWHKQGPRFKNRGVNGVKP
jgi:hypothetical protein